MANSRDKAKDLAVFWWWMVSHYYPELEVKRRTDWATMKLNSSPGTTDWVCIRMCGFVHKRSICHKHISSSQLWPDSQPSYNLQAHKSDSTTGWDHKGHENLDGGCKHKNTSSLFSDSSQSSNRSRRMHCSSILPFNTITHCSDCAAREWVEWCYTGKRGMWSRGFWQTTLTVHSAHCRSLGNQAEANEAARWISPIHLGKCLCALWCLSSCDHCKKNSDNTWN